MVLWTLLQSWTKNISYFPKDYIVSNNLIFHTITLFKNLFYSKYIVKLIRKEKHCKQFIFDPSFSVSAKYAVDIFTKIKNRRIASGNFPRAVLFVHSKNYFNFLSNWMGYDRGDSFPFDFQPNGIQFGSKRKLLPRSHTIQFETK